MSSTQHTAFTWARLTLQIAVCMLVWGWASFAYAATLSVSPGTGVYSVGQTFTATVVVNTAGSKINAAEGTLSFKTNELSVVGVSKGSIFNLWTAEPAYSNSAGTVTFSGGTPTGYTGGSGTVLSVTFKVLAAGTPKVSFSNGAVLAADGRGTNVLTNMSGGSYTTSAPTSTPEPETIIEYVAPANTPGLPAVQSSTHPDSDAWYKATTAQLTWTLPSGVTAVRTLLDERATSVPTKVYDTPIDSIELTDLEEGVQYFHVQFKNTDGWGKVAHYRLAIDSVAPTSLVLKLREGADLSNPDQELVAELGEDTGSAVLRFLLQIDGAEPLEVTRTHATATLPLPTLEPGYHTVVAEAFDMAGNSVMGSLSFTILAFDKPVFTDVPERISSGVIPVFIGATRPNAEVEVTFTQTGTESVVYKIASDGNGVFRFIPDNALATGVYDLVARATDQYGALSEPSDTVRVVVEAPGYLRIGTLLVSVLSVFVPLLALALLLSVATVLTIRKFRRMRYGVVREAHEAIAIIEREFTALTKELDVQAETLRGSRKSGKLTKMEESLFKTLTQSLSAARVTIAKEVTDVEDVIDS